jgi:hypothetical protein
MFPCSLLVRRLLAVVLAALIALPQVGFAQASGADTQKVQLLFVQNGSGAEFDKAKGTLRLKNVGHSTPFFADRPVRLAGHYRTRDEFLKLWSEGPDSFATSPSNATLSLLEVGQHEEQIR